MKMQSQQDRIFGLDLLRAFAILGVLFHHLVFIQGVPKIFYRAFEMGWIGVDLFFVLSGYLIGGQAFKILKKTMPISERLFIFWIRRWTRTLPLYFFVMIIYLYIKPLIYSTNVVSDQWTYFVFLQNFILPGEFSQSWSLCIEEQFYLFFPIVCFLLKKQRIWIWCLPFLFSFGIRLSNWWMLNYQFPDGLIVDDFWKHQITNLFHYRTFSHMDGLSLGVFLAATQQLWSNWQLKTRRALAWLGVLSVIIFSYTRSMNTFDFKFITHFSVLAIGFSAILIGFYDLKFFPKIVALPIEKIALWSYGAYLWNNAALRIPSYLPINTNWILKVIVYFGFTFLISWLTYCCIEKPGLKLRNILLNKQEQTA